MLGPNIVLCHFGQAKLVFLTGCKDATLASCAGSRIAFLKCFEVADAVQCITQRHIAFNYLGCVHFDRFVIMFPPHCVEVFH